MKLMHLLVLPFLAGSLVLSGCGSDNNHQSSVAEHIERSDAYTDQGQFRAAMIEARNAIQIDKTSIKAKAQLAKIYNTLGYGKAALEALEGTEDSTDPDVILERAKSLNQASKFRSTIELLEANESSLANNKRFQYHLAEAYLARNNRKQAEELYQKLLADNPNDVVALVGIGNLRGGQNKLEEAEAFANKAIKADPENIKAMMLQAKLYLSKKEIQKAEDKLSEALSNLPQTDIMTVERYTLLQTLSNLLTSQGRTNEAYVYSKLLAENNPALKQNEQTMQEIRDLYRQGKLDEAIRKLEVLYTRSKSDMVGSSLAQLYAEKGNIGKAENLLSEHMDTELASDAVLTKFLLMQVDLGKEDEVIKTLSEELKHRPDNQALQAIYGYALLTKGDEEKGLPIFKKALKSGSVSPRMHLILASYYEKKGDQANRQAELDKAFKKAPNDSFTVKALMRNLFDQNKPSKAIALANQLNKKNSTPESAVLLVSAYIVSADTAKAEAQLGKALKQYPNSADVKDLALRFYVNAKKWSKVETLATGIITADKNHPSAYNAYMLAHNQQNKLDQGIQQVKSWAQNNASWSAYLALTQLTLSQGKAKEALDHLTKAEEITATSQDISNQAYELRLGIANSLYVKRDYPLARQTVLDAYQSDTDRPEALILLTKIELASGNHDEAQKIVDRLNDNGQKDLAILLTGDKFMYKKEYSKAAEMYTELWKKSKNVSMARKLTLAYRRAKQEDGYLNIIDEWSKEQPNSIEPDMDKADYFMSVNKNQKSVDVYEDILKRDKNNPIALNNAAYLYGELGQFKKALAYSSRAYELAPNSANILDTHGWVLHLNKRHKESLPLLEKAAKMAPNDVGIAEHIKAVKKAL